jgi:predicted ATP-binding protein involved in virulence
MSNPIAEGTKSLSEGLNQAREAGKSLTKSIEDIQHDGIEVAKQELDALKRKRLIEEARENSLIYKAIDEYESQKAVIIAENKAEKEFKSKYGEKEWNKVLELKTVVEKEHKENTKYYGHKLDDVKRVQFYCWVVAAFITYLLWKFDLV